MCPFLRYSGPEPQRFFLLGGVYMLHIELFARFLLVLFLWLISGQALAMRAIDFADYRLPRDGAIALPVVESERLTGVAAVVDEATGGNLSAALNEADFTGQVGDVLTLYGVSPYTRIDLVGVGGETIDRVAAEDFGGRLAMLNDGASGTPLRVLWHDLNRAPHAWPSASCSVVIASIAISRTGSMHPDKAR